MTNAILLKRSSISGKIPLTSELLYGEIALNTYDGKAYFKKNDGTESVVNILTSSSGTISTSQLGSGTTNTTTFLRGDGTWSNTLTGPLITTSSTSSTSTSSGALLVSGGIGVAENINAGGYISTRGGVGGLQTISGSGSTWYNAFLRNDSANVYLLSSDVQTTQALATNATWNAFRPFSWNLATGNVAIASNGSSTIVGGSLTVNGDLLVNGVNTIINTSTLTVDDKNIDLGAVASTTVSTTGTVGSISGIGPWTATITGMTDTADLVIGSVISATAGSGSLGTGGSAVVTSIISNTSLVYTYTGGTTPIAGTITTITTTGASDSTANGGGITLKGATDKTILWDSTNTNWTSSENWNIATGKVYKINNTSVLSSTTLGSTITASSLTSVGTITSGTWSGSFGAVSGANLTNITAGNLTGTIPSAVLGNSTVYIGTTAIALNRASASQTLTGVSIDGTAGTATNINAADNQTNSSYYPVFATAQGTSVSTGTDSGFIYNPSTGSLTAGKYISSNSSAQSLSDGAIILNGGSGAIVLDDSGHKRLSWNDGGGNLNIRAGNYFNGTTTTYAKGAGDANSGAASIIIGCDAVDGSIQLATAAIGTPGAAVSYSNTVTIGTTQLTISATTASTSSTTGSLVVSGGVGVAGAIYASSFNGSGSGLTSLTAGNLTGTIPSTVLGNSTHYIGTTAVALNRASGALALTGITSIDGSSASSSTLAITNIDTAGTYYIPFTSSTTGNATFSVDGTTTPLSYNPNTGTISCAILSTTGNVTVGGNISIPDNKNLYIGSGNDLYLIHDGTNTSIVNQTGNLQITNIATGGGIALRSEANSGSNFELWSAAAYLDATTSYFRSQDGLTTYGYFNSTGVYSQNSSDWPIRSLSTSATNTSRGGYLQQRSNSGAAVVSGTVLGGLSAGGHNGTSLTSGWNGGGELLFTTTEAWGAAANGTKFTVNVSANGATSPTTRLTIDQDGTTTVNGTLTVSGDLIINGTSTTINSTTISVDDINIELGSVASPTNVTANGGGIILKGATDKTILWDATNANWNSSENFNIATGKIYKINNASVLSASALGSSVTASSLTSVGTITSGTWSAAFGAVSGANLTSLTAGNLTGAIPSAVLGNSTVYIGTTAVPLNRASGAIALTGITSIDCNVASATTATTANQLNCTSYSTYSDWTANNLAIQYYNIAGAPDGSAYSNGFQSLYSSDTTYGWQIVMGTNNDNNVYFRKRKAGVFNSWQTLLSAGNYNSYSPTLTGTGASGTWGINISGNAASATTAANYLPLAGGTITGNLTVSGGTVTATTFTGNAASATSCPNYLPLAGGTMTGEIVSADVINMVKSRWSGVDRGSVGGLPTGVGFVSSTGTMSALVPYGTTNFQIVGALGVGTAPSSTTGEIRATSNITAYYSDGRLKTIKSNIPNALQSVLSLNGVIYTNNDVAKSFGYTTDEEQVGVIAQEVEKVLPQVVTAAPFDIGQNEDGSEYSKSGENYKTVRYDKLVPLLIEAIKELEARVKELESKQGI